MILMIVSAFVFWYPLIMSTMWIMGGMLFYFRRERNSNLPLLETPLVSILIPCYNEAENIENTVVNLLRLNYCNYEIIAINDGSRDSTSEKLHELAQKHEGLRIIDLKQNAGKANALYLGLLAAKGEYLIGVDADSYLDRNALNYIIPHFITPRYGERVGAVTGNPRVRNRSSLISRIQLCEFSSIIGLIKRSQRIFGKVMTVSGVVVAFRKKALLDCGLWDRDLITEDIGVTWKLQKRFWDVRYEPKAICWMLVPETISGIWKQRVRWAQGGMEVLIRHRDIFTDWRYRRLIPVYIEEVLSIAWAIAWSVLTALYLIRALYGGPEIFQLVSSGAYLSVICLIQFFIAMKIDSCYDENLLKYYLWAIWYPTFYWYFNALVVLRAIPKAISFTKRENQFATWTSPDRGLEL